MSIWDELFEKAREQYHPEEVSPFVYAHHGWFCHKGDDSIKGIDAEVVGKIITSGIKMSHSEHLEKEMFETEYGVTGMVKEKSRAYENTFSLGIAGGVGLCVLSVVPIIIAWSANGQAGMFIVRGIYSCLWQTYLLCMPLAVERTGCITY